MAKTCPNCIYYNAPDTSCRWNAPAPLVAPKPTADVTFWPPMAATDWCRNGWNATDGFYDINWRKNIGSNQQ